MCAGLEESSPPSVILGVDLLERCQFLGQRFLPIFPAGEAVTQAVADHLGFHVLDNKQRVGGREPA